MFIRGFCWSNFAGMFPFSRRIRHNIFMRYSSSKKISIAVLFFASLVLMGQGCVTLRFGGPAPVQNGGVYVSEDKGEVWTQKVFAGVVKNKTQTISTANVSKFLFHPLDPKLMYLGTGNLGLRVSTDGAETWNSTLTGAGAVNAIGLDPTSTQIVYVGIGGQIHKTTDGGTSWAIVYTQAVAGYTINAVAVDPLNARHVYAGASNGALLFSDDSGTSWRTLGAKYFSGGIRDMYFHESDPGLMLIATPSAGVFRSPDRGTTWTELIPTTLATKFPGSLTTGVILMNKRSSSTMLYSSAYGIMRTADGGKTWEGVPLLTKPGEVAILSFAANPFDFEEIYYGTSANFY